MVSEFASSARPLLFSISPVLRVVSIVTELAPMPQVLEVTVLGDVVQVRGRQHYH